MRKSVMLLPIVAGLALTAVSASATSISGILSIIGSDKYSIANDTVSIDAGTSQIGGTSTGTLAAFTGGNAVDAYSFAFGSAFTSGTEIYSSTENGVTITYTLLSATSVVDSTGLLVEGTGTLTETGYSDTAASFSLTTQNGGLDINDVTYSSTILASATPQITTTPEPASITLLGTGLLSFAGLLRRKLKK